jgi:hypothetical protein
MCGAFARKGAQPRSTHPRSLRYRSSMSCAAVMGFTRRLPGRSPAAAALRGASSVCSSSEPPPAEPSPAELTRAEPTPAEPSPAEPSPTLRGGASTPAWRSCATELGGRPGRDASGWTLSAPAPAVLPPPAEPLSAPAPAVLPPPAETLSAPAPAVLPPPAEPSGAKATAPPLYLSPAAMRSTFARRSWIVTGFGAAGSVLGKVLCSAAVVGGRGGSRVGLLAGAALLARRERGTAGTAPVCPHSDAKLAVLPSPRVPRGAKGIAPPLNLSPCPPLTWACEGRTLPCRSPCILLPSACVAPVGPG